MIRTVPFIVERAFSETTGRILRRTVGAEPEARGAAAERDPLGEGFADPDPGAAMFSLEFRDADSLPAAAALSADSGFEIGVRATGFDAADGFVEAAVDGVPEGVAEAEPEAVELGLEVFVERRKKRGRNKIANSTTAVAPTSTILFELEDLGGVGTRRGPAMVAFTWGSEETGIRVRGGGVVTFGETGESGTANGSICGSGCRCELPEEAVAAAA